MRRTTICKQHSDSKVDNAATQTESQDINIQIQMSLPYNLLWTHWQLFVSQFPCHLK